MLAKWIKVLVIPITTRLVWYNCSFVKVTVILTQAWWVLCLDIRLLISSGQGNPSAQYGMAPFALWIKPESNVFVLAVIIPPLMSAMWWIKRTSNWPPQIAVFSNSSQYCFKSSKIISAIRRRAISLTDLSNLNLTFSIHASIIFIQKWNEIIGMSPNVISSFFPQLFVVGLK
jgi:hypothetical protein